MMRMELRMTVPPRLLSQYTQTTFPAGRDFIPCFRDPNPLPWSQPLYSILRCCLLHVLSFVFDRKSMANTLDTHSFILLHPWSTAQWVACHDFVHICWPIMLYFHWFHPMLLQEMAICPLALQFYNVSSLLLFFLSFFSLRLHLNSCVLPSTCLRISFRIPRAFALVLIECTS